MNLGGPAARLVSVRQSKALEEALEWAAREEWAVRILGGGSNLVVADRGVDGLVITPDFRGVDVDLIDDGAIVVVGAGESLDDLVARTVDEGLVGLECLSGIPGTVGATPIQNVGAYGVEAAEVLAWIDAFDRRTGRCDRMAPEACGFGYRTSCFRANPDRWVVLRVAFRLRRGGAPALRYPELRRMVESRAGGPSPDGPAVRDAVLTLRRAKGMVLDEHSPGTAGSFFVNPVVGDEALARIDAAVPEDSPPAFEIGPGATKVSAAWLIEQAGFARGTRRGSVGVSKHHALALVHYGGGRTRDLVGLASAIREAVHRRFGIRLRPEPVFWGFSEGDPLGGGLT